MKKSLIVCISSIILFFACKRDVVINESELHGEWELISAKRNGNETSTLDNAFFNFNNGKLSHNVNGEEVTSNYEMKSNTLIFSDDALIKEILISSILKDTLEFSTKISNFKFEFRLKKKNE